VLRGQGSSFGLIHWTRWLYCWLKASMMIAGVFCLFFLLCTIKGIKDKACGSKHFKVLSYLSPENIPQVLPKKVLGTGMELIIQGIRRSLNHSEPLCR
jgi:hypothetical protein